MHAVLRTCARCEWIYRFTDLKPVDDRDGECPKCGFCSYGARYVYGDRCYRYSITQKTWLRKQTAKCEREKSDLEKLKDKIESERDELKERCNELEIEIGRLNSLLDNIN